MQPILACIPDDEAVRQRIAAVTGTGDCVPYKGSIPGACARCGAAVWIGPKQQEVLHLGPVILCLPCCAPEAVGAPVVKLSDRQWGD